VLKKILKSQSITARLMTGSFWLGAGGAAEQGLRFLRNMIVARLIAPTELGVMAIILVSNYALESFTQVGLKEAIIQHDNGDSKKYLNGAWYFALVRTTILYIIGYFIAPLIAHFYQVADLTLMLRVSMISLFLKGLISVEAYAQLKKMNYLKWMVINNIGGLTGIITAIILAFHLRNIWAIIWGYIAESLFRFILSYVLCPFFPEKSFDRKYLKDLLQFSKGIFGLPILLLLFFKIDVLVLGKMVDKELLGLYSMGSSLAQMPLVLVSVFLEPMLYPTLSRLKSNKEQLEKALVYVIRLIYFLGVPLTICSFLFGKYILSIIYGQQYATVGVSFALLFTATVVRLATVPVVSTLIVLGLPHIHRKYTIIRTIILILIIIPMVKIFSINGAAGSVLLVLFVVGFVQIVQIQKHTGLTINVYMKTILLSIGFSIPAIIIYVVAKLTGYTNNYLMLAWGCVAYALSTTIVSVKYVPSILHFLKGNT